MSAMIYSKVTMKRLWNRVLTMWQPASALMLGAVIVLFLFSFRLSSLPRGISVQEAEAGNTSSTVKAIIENPVNAPYKIARYGITRVTTRLDVQRGMSAAIAVLVVLLFYIIASKFFTPFSAAAGTLLFATSSLLLNNSRLAVPNVMLLSLFALIACGYALRFNTKNSVLWLVASFIVALSLFVPGMALFILAGALWQLKSLQRPIGNVRPAVLALCFIVIAAAIGLIAYALFLNPGLWRGFVGIPEVLPGPLELLKSVASVPLGIFALSPENPLYRLGKQPVLDVFASCMFVLGSYAMIKKHSLDRVSLFGGIFILASILIAVSGNYEYIFILLPFIYLIIIAGIEWMVAEWFKVFPRNPLARSGALVLIALAVFFSCAFQARRYFIAWPNNHNTKAVFERS